MLDKRFYNGFEDEEAVKIWKDDNGAKSGIVIWRGFFETILEGCFVPNFHKNGLVECYYNQDGFYVDKWEMRFPMVVLSELARFDESLFDVHNEEMVREAKQIIEYLAAFINEAIENSQQVYIEYT